MQSRGWVNGRDTNFLRRANSVNWSNFSPKVNYFTAWWAWWNSFAYLRGLGRSFTLSTRFGKDQLRDITWFGAARNLTLHQCIDLQCVTMFHPFVFYVSSQWPFRLFSAKCLIHVEEVRICDLLRLGGGALYATMTGEVIALAVSYVPKIRHYLFVKTVHLRQFYKNYWMATLNQMGLAFGLLVW